MYTKRRRKKKSKKLLLLIIIPVIAAIVAGGVLYGLDKYIRAAHPMEYAEYVEHYSGKYGLDKYMVYAFIKTESGFDPMSESNLGARGLMQIMPDTFEWIRYRLDEEDSGIEFDSMYNEQDNIRYGCYLLSYLEDEFGGGLTETAAAYHAGPGSVGSWLENPDYGVNGRLAAIPNPDTAHYVDKITDAYETYCRLYK
ncbi:MAG: lytic transglycosylase domain-containing protein [Eubacterium sp.]|nr:lytic transglycosylase domain-containing protein [Eubacterium sp.]